MPGNRLHADVKCLFFCGRWGHEGKHGHLNNQRRLQPLTFISGRGWIGGEGFGGGDDTRRMDNLHFSPSSLPDCSPLPLLTPPGSSLPFLSTLIARLPSSTPRIYSGGGGGSRFANARHSLTHLLTFSRHASAHTTHEPDEMLFPPQQSGADGGRERWRWRGGGGRGSAAFPLAPQPTAC